MTVQGISTIDKEVQIDRMGRIILPDLMPIYAQGKTLKSVEEYRLRALKLNDASASVYLALSATRLIAVKIIGAVNNPQTVAVPAYTPISQVPSRSGRISAIGSLRNITLTVSNQHKTKVDLYNLLRETQDFKEPLIVIYIYM